MVNPVTPVLQQKLASLQGRADLPETLQTGDGRTVSTRPAGDGQFYYVDEVAPAQVAPEAQRPTGGPTILGEAGKALQSVGSRARGVLDYQLESLGRAAGIRTMEEQGAEGGAARREFQQSVAPAVPTVGSIKSPRDAALFAAQVVPSAVGDIGLVAAPAVAGVLTGNPVLAGAGIAASGAFGAGQGQSEVYNSLIEQGVDPVLAQRRANQYAPISAALEATPVAAGLGRLGRASGNIFQRTGKAAGTSMLEEGGTEALQEAAQMGVEASVGITPESTAAALDRLGTAFVAGGLGGGFFGGATGLASRGERPQVPPTMPPVDVAPQETPLLPAPDPAIADQTQPISVVPRIQDRTEGPVIPMSGLVPSGPAIQQQPVTPGSQPQITFQPGMSTARTTPRLPDQTPLPTINQPGTVPTDLPTLNVPPGGFNAPPQIPQGVQPSVTVTGQPPQPVSPMTTLDPVQPGTTRMPQPTVLPTGEQPIMQPGATPQPFDQAITVDPSGAAQVPTVAAGEQAVDTAPAPEAVRRPTLEELQAANPRRPSAMSKVPTSRLRLHQFVAKNGGIKPTRDIANFEGNVFVPGLGPMIRADGLDLDDMRELVQEAGYLGVGDDLFTDINDFLEALSDDLAYGMGAKAGRDGVGRPRYPVGSELETAGLVPEIDYAFDEAQSMVKQFFRDRGMFEPRGRFLDDLATLYLETGSEYQVIEAAMDALVYGGDVPELDVPTQTLDYGVPFDEPGAYSSTLSDPFAEPADDSEAASTGGLFGEPAEGADADTEVAEPDAEPSPEPQEALGGGEQGGTSGTDSEPESGGTTTEEPDRQPQTIDEGDLREDGILDLDYGTAEEPNKAALQRQFAADLAPIMQGKEPSVFFDLRGLRSRASQIMGLPVENGTLLDKAVQEAFEAAQVQVARDEQLASLRAMEGKDPETIRAERASTLNRMTRFLIQMPNLSARTGRSRRLQQYSTPVDLAYFVQSLVDLRDTDSVYEPTAGNGALVASASSPVLNEIDPDRAGALSRTFEGSVVTQNDAVEFVSEAGPFDVVVSNPPFGPLKGVDGRTIEHKVDGFSTTTIDHAIALRALAQMDDEGRAGLIIGGPSPVFLQKIANLSDDDATAAIEDFYRDLPAKKVSFYKRLYRDYNVVEHLIVPGENYTKQGASWPTEVIIIRGKGEATRELPFDRAPEIIGSDYAKEYLARTDIGDIDERPAIQPEDPSGLRPDTGQLSGDVTQDDGGTEAGPDAISPSGPTDDGLGNQTGQTDGGGTSGSPSGSGSGRDDGGTVPDVPDQSGERGGVSVDGNADRPDSPSEQSGEAQSGSDTRGPREQRPGDGAQPDGEQLSAAEEQAELQVDYATRSNAPFKVGTLVPTPLREAFQRALDAVEAAHGNIDDFVQAELGYTDKAQFQSAFSAEQVDALGMAIYNFKLGNGFILGDQTGVGKGRVVAGLLRYGMRNGLKPIFVTEKPDLYSAMIADLQDIGMTDAQIKPLITNMDSKVKPTMGVMDGAPLYRMGSQAARKKIIANPADGIGSYNMVFTTYNQMQKVAGKETARTKFFDTLSREGMVIFDEAHNAGGSGQQAKSDVRSTAELARQMVDQAKYSAFSSATYAKNPNVMDLYRSTAMKYGVSDPAALAELLNEFGVPMQQIMSQMLAEGAGYIRRERSFDGVDYENRDVPVDIDDYNTFARILQAVFDLSDRHVEAAVKAMRASLKGQAASKVEASKIGVEHTKFSSRMFNLINSMLPALKSTQAAEAAIAELRNGRKPVLTFARTNESFLQDYMKENGFEVGDEANITFKDMLTTYVQKSLLVKQKTPDADGNEIETIIDIEPFLDAKGKESLAFARGLIAQAEFGSLPVSPIDFVRAQITQAGYSVSEITGRTNTIEYQADGAKSYGQRDLSELGPSGKQNSITRFNNGGLDALILNQSGSTGISLHASEKFKDQTPRTMIVVQPELDINTHMQMLGRIHRTAQVVLPKYIQLTGDVPAEQRVSANLARKMASLGALSTGNRRTAMSGDALDFFNVYGDEVVELIVREDLALQIATGRVPDGNPGFAEKFTGRIMLLDYDQQVEFYEQLQADYTARLQRAIADGDNKLEATFKDYNAKPLRQTVAVERSGESPFQGEVKLVEAEIEIPFKPKTSAEVRELLQSQLEVELPTKTDRMLAAAEAQKDEFRAKNITPSVRAFEKFRDLALSGIDDPERRRKLQDEASALSAKFNRLTSVLFPGAAVKVQTPAGTVAHGVVTAIAASGKSKNPLALSDWKVYVDAYSGEQARITLPLSQIDRNGFEREFDTVVEPEPRNFEYQGSTPGQAFDDAQGKKKTARRVFLTGNLITGADRAQGDGTIVRLSTNKGDIIRAIEMKQDSLENAASNMDEGYSTTAEALQILNADIQLIGSMAKGLSVRKDGDKLVMNVISAYPNSRAIITNTALLDMTIAGDAPQTRSGFRFEVPWPRAGAFLSTLDEFTSLRPDGDINKVRTALGKPPVEIDDTDASFSVVRAPERSMGGMGDDQLKIALQGVVDRVTGQKASVEFTERLIGGGEAAVASGSTADRQDVGGMYRRGIVTLSLDRQFDTLGNAYHEAFHALEDFGLFTDQEMEALNRNRDRMAKIISERGLNANNMSDAEIRSTAFGIYAEREAGKRRGNGLTPPALRAFVRVARLLDNVRNAIAAVLGKRPRQLTLDDVFGRAMSGEVGRRNATRNPDGDTEFSLMRLYKKARDGYAEARGMGKAYSRIDKPMTTNSDRERLLRQDVEITDFASRPMEYLRERLGYQVSRFRTAAINRFDAAERTERMLNGGELREGKDSSIKMAELAMMSNGAIQTALEDGPVRYNKRTGLTERVADWERGGFRKLFEPLAKRDLLDVWEEWAIAKRGKGIRARDERTRAEGKAKLAQAEAMRNRRKELEQQLDAEKKALGVVEAILQLKKLSKEDRKKAKNQEKALNKIIRQLRQERNALAKPMKTLTKQGREQAKVNRQGIVTDEKIAEMDEVFSKLPADVQREFEQLATDVNDFNRYMLDFQVDTGLVTPEQRDVLAEHDFYIPFYRMMDKNNARGFRQGQNKLEGQRSTVKKLEGSERQINSPIENMVFNLAATIERGRRNVAAVSMTNLFMEVGAARLQPKDKKRNAKDREAVEAALGNADVPVPEEMLELAEHFYSSTMDDAETITIMRDGQIEKYDIEDPLMLAALQAIDPVELSGVVNVLGMAKGLLTAGVTKFDPVFGLRNLARDVLSVQATQSEIKGYNPVKVGARLLGNMHRELPHTKKLMTAGAVFGGYDAARPVNVRREINQLKGKGKILKSAGDVVDVIASFNQRLERVTREQVYQSALDQGMSEFEAAHQALKVINFSRTGNNITLRSIYAIVPFLNARVQGLDRLVYGAKENPKRFLLTVGVLAAATLALYAINKDNPEYEELEEWDKDNFWHFWLGGQHFKIPRPFEVGVLSATVPERAARLAMGDDTLGATVSSGLDALVNTFGLDPTPQAIKPLLDVAVNKDFKGRPIVSMGQEGRLGDDQFDSYTSQTARLLAKITPGQSTWQSPEVIDYLTRGYFGTLGSYFLSVTDGAVGLATDLDEDTAPRRRTESLPVAGNFVRSFLPQSERASSSYTTEFYRIRNRVNAIQRSLSDAQKRGDVQRVQKLLKQERDEIAAYQTFNAVARTMTKMRRQQDAINRSTSLTRAQKIEKNEEINRQIKALAKRVLARYPALTRMVVEADAA